jgi:hypothetical protein
MFGKGKKNRANGHSSVNNVQEMFLSLAEDPEDPNSVITLEGKDFALTDCGFQVISWA